MNVDITNRIMHTFLFDYTEFRDHSTSTRQCRKPMFPLGPTVMVSELVSGFGIFILVRQQVKLSTVPRFMLTMPVSTH